MPTRFFTGRHRFFSEWGFLAAEFFYGFFSKILSDFLPKALTDRKNCDIIIDGFAPFVNLGQSQRGEIFPKKRRKKRPKMAKKELQPKWLKSFNFLAQRRGFEPPVGFRPTHDFQSCSLNHSDISA